MLKAPHCADEIDLVALHAALQRTSSVPTATAETSVGGNLAEIEHTGKGAFRAIRGPGPGTGYVDARTWGSRWLARRAARLTHIAKAAPGTAGGTTLFNQQRAFGPCTPGFT